jgi:hypothetical protein
MSKPQSLQLSQSSAVSKHGASSTARYHRCQADMHLPQRRTRCNKALIGTTTLLLLVVLSGLGSWFYQAHTSSTHAANASFYQKAILTASLGQRSCLCDPLERQVTQMDVRVSLSLSDRERFTDARVGGDDPG